MNESNLIEYTNVGTMGDKSVDQLIVACNVGAEQKRHGGSTTPARLGEGPPNDGKLHAVRHAEN